MKILTVVGARPNFIKAAPLHLAFRMQPGIESVLVHTGQHYDACMSDVFFRQLALPKPAYFLGVGSGSHTEQTARIMLAFERVLTDARPDVVVVVGDVNSTVACTLVAVKMGIPVAHVEAGLRSFDRRMPEELNRVLVDSVADELFVTEPAGLQNLLREGIPAKRVHYVGNAMIDALVHYRPLAARTNVVARLGLTPGRYALTTMHRPANVDTDAGLWQVVRLIEGTAAQLPVVFPLHPRTRRRLAESGWLNRLVDCPNVRLLEPQGYLEFLNLMEHAQLLLTDSGGIQDETTFLRVPCLTFRDTTERPITVEIGTNQLLRDLDPVTARARVADVLAGRARPGQIPPFWDGRAAERIAIILNETYAPKRQVAQTPSAP